MMLILSVIGSATAHAQSWNLVGNIGTNANNHFVGTLDKASLSFRVNNLEQMRINQWGRITFQAQNAVGEVSGKNLLLGSGINGLNGFNNTVFGLGAFTVNPGGRSATAIGNNVLAALSTGDRNTGLGANALRLTTGGSDNTGIGMGALEGAGTLEANTAVGQGALARTTAVATDNISYNTAVGHQAMTNLGTGEANCALGYQTLQAFQNGSNNIAIGRTAGFNLEKGENNIFIGTETPATGTAVDNELNIGNWIFGVNGTIGIGTFTNPLPADGIAPDGEKYKLFVKDGIRTEKLKVDVAANNGWADYVFHKDYQLLSLKEVESFISKNGHLPEVPSTEEAIKNGVELKAMNILLLKKIEELTLYTIEQQKRLEVLEKKMVSQN